MKPNAVSLRNQLHIFGRLTICSSQAVLEYFLRRGMLPSAFL
uniref:Uncharacterized protein n=1 Tax=Aegilops tauschii subsp. strangulata TaxID=200361 RepID=A0A453QVM6_AEGTS